MENKFYITTPIYYATDIPHIGHAYTTIAADILARWNKLQGKKVFFTTGTDDHGRKVLEYAERNGKSPKEFVDELIPIFKKTWKSLNLEYDKFVRTTDTQHKKIVKEVLYKMYQKGDIYKGKYKGYYCVGCEAYLTKKELTKNLECPIHKKKAEWIEEESYFFKLSKYQDKLLKFYEKNSEFILPIKKQKEIIQRVKKGLKDISISRIKIKWGIPLPFDKNHVTYVWLDALFNYYSSTREKGKEIFWPTDLHLIGKDILWFHAVYWPAFLMSAEITLPKKIFAHGFWISEGHKMSKSLGNVISPEKLISIAGVDSARYFLFRSTPFGDDGNFSEKALIERHNNELADKFGNLISRVSGLIEKKGMKKTKNNLIKKLDQDKIKKLFENYEFDKVLNEIFRFIDACNEYIQNKKPWEKSCKNKEKILYELADSIKAITILLWPFMPSSCEKIANQFKFKINLKEINKPLKENSKIKKGQILFEKIKCQKT